MKNISIILIFLLISQVLLHAGPGRIQVFKDDGSSISGELLAVRPDSLVILSYKGNKEFPPREGIRKIVVKTKRKFLPGFLLGAVVGGILLSSKKHGTSYTMMSMVMVAPITGLLGGALTGSGLKKQVFDFQGKSPEQKTAMWLVLERHALVAY